MTAPATGSTTPPADPPLDEFAPEDWLAQIDSLLAPTQGQVPHGQTLIFNPATDAFELITLENRAQPGDATAQFGSNLGSSMPLPEPLREFADSAHDGITLEEWVAINRPPAASANQPPSIRTLINYEGVDDQFQATTLEYRIGESDVGLRTRNRVNLFRLSQGRKPLGEDEEAESLSSHKDEMIRTLNVEAIKAYFVERYGTEGAKLLRLAEQMGIILRIDNTNWYTWNYTAIDGRTISFTDTLTLHGATTYLYDQARAILAREGIDINEAANGVFLPSNSSVARPPATTHSKVHTDRYYREVEQRLRNAAPGTLRTELERIASELLNGTFPF